jgi:anti-sigma factor RsiW
MRTTACQQALEYLSAYMEDAETRGDALAQALNHMRGCPECQHNSTFLAQALTAAKEDRMNCRDCQEWLPDYLQAEEDGQADQAQWQKVALHLTTCPVCAAAYAELAELAALANKEPDIEPAAYPAPRLDFLREQPAQALQPAKVPWRLDQLGRLVIELSADLLRSLQTPAFQPGYAGAGLKSQANSVLWALNLVDAVEDLEVAITTQPLSEAPERCRMSIQVSIPSRGGWPNLAGTTISLQRDQQELATRTTDPFGIVVFSELAITDLPHLQVTILPTHRS